MVTTGNELLQYRGDEDLAGGDAGNAAGQASSDFTAVQNLALRAYEVNKINYQREQADRDEMEKEFTDPNVNYPLDEELALQVDGRLKELGDLMKQNPEMYQDKTKYWEFKTKYQGLLNDNAKLKTVQAEKDKYKKLAGEERDEQKKSAYEAHIKELSGYKLGKDIPAFKDTFAFREQDLPSTIVGTPKKYQRLNGDNLEDIEETVYNPLGADAKAKEMAAKDGNAAKTGETIAKGIFLHGEIDDYNDKVKTAYADAFKFNYENLAAVHKDEYDAFKRKNPTASFETFLETTGKGPEVKKILDGLAFLKGGLQFVPGVDSDGDGVIDDAKLPGYTYDAKGMRLNVDDDTLRAIMGTIKQPVGRVRTVNGKVSKLAAEIANEKAGTRKLIMDANGNMVKSNATAANQYAQAKKNTAQAGKIAAEVNATLLPPSEVPLVQREATLKKITTPGKPDEYQFLISNKKIPENIMKKMGFGLTEPKAPTAAATNKERKTYIDAKKDYDDGIKEMREGSTQMRFSDGTTDITATVAELRKKYSLEQVMEYVRSRGFVTKFVNKDGKIVGTTESLGHSNGE